jgi:hypothetical protein
VISLIEVYIRRDVSIVEAEEWIWDRHGRGFTKLKDFHCDRPYIAFIRTHDGFTRQRIGKRLLFKATGIIQDRLGLAGIHSGESSTRGTGGRAFFTYIERYYRHRLKSKNLPGSRKKDYVIV